MCFPRAVCVCDPAFQPGEAAWIIIAVAFHSLVPLAVIFGAAPFEVPLCFIRRSLNAGGASGTLTRGLFPEMLTV